MNVSAANLAPKSHDSTAGSLDGVPLVCPLCHGELSRAAQRFRCQPCSREYPIHDGIPDFRVFPDPYLGFAEDRQRTEIVLQALADLPLPALLEHYWSYSDITPPPLRAKYIRSALRGADRAQSALAALNQRLQATAPAGGHRVLEIGSGTGNFLHAAAACYPQVVGADIGMRWLHLSRRRFMDAGLPTPPLICCCAEYLPFPAGAFTLAVCASTLEFTREPTRCLAEAARVLDDRGVFSLDTVNRFSLVNNPYVHLWGVGYLPRAWQARYVRWRCQASYEQVRLMSLAEINCLARTYFSRIEAHLPDINREVQRQLPWTTYGLVHIYRIWKQIPGLRSVLNAIAPEWQFLLYK